MASALLTHHKTDVNCPGRHGMTPIMYAAQAGHERMAVLLLRLRADRYRCNQQVCLVGLCLQSHKLRVRLVIPPCRATHS